MSRENVEIAVTGYEAVLRGESSDDFLAADFEVHDRTLPEVSESRRGPDAMRAVREAMADAFDDFRYDVEEARDLGDRVLVRAHVFARGRGSGIDLDGTMGHLWTFAHGKATRLDVYGSWAQALEAVGLSE